MVGETLVSVWNQYWEKVGNESYLAAKQLAERSLRLREVLMHEYLAETAEDRYDENDRPFQVPVANIDWTRFAEDLDAGTHGFSTTERAAASWIAALTNPGRTIVFSGHERMDNDFWRILVEWGTGGHATVVTEPI